MTEAPPGNPDFCKPANRKWLFPTALAIVAATAMSHPAVSRGDTFTQFGLQNVGFSDGSSASGTFVYDATTNKITQWNISYGGGTAGVPTFTSAGSSPFAPAASNSSNAISIQFNGNANPADDIQLYLPSAIGTVAEPIGITELYDGTNVPTNASANPGGGGTCAFPIAGCETDLSSPNASIVPVPDTITQFKLKNVGFADGSSATGMFTYDATKNKIIQWNISYVGGAGGVPSFTSFGSSPFTPAPSNSSNAVQIQFNGTANPADDIQLYLPSAIGTVSEPIGVTELYDGTNVPTNASANPGGGGTCAFPIAGCETDLSSSNGLIDPVSEPPALVILGGSLGLLLLSSRVARHASPLES